MMLSTRPTTTSLKCLRSSAPGDPGAYGATLDDVREAVTTLEDAERTARRVLGGAHPLTMVIERALQNARAALRARETPSPAESA